jgi:phosphoribosylanthranilate isomerase
MIADWSLVSKLGLSKPLILAGGLNPENIIQAIHVAKPFAVDLSSGLESRPGCKDHDKIRYLFAAIRGSNAH